MSDANAPLLHGVVPSEKASQPAEGQPHSQQQQHSAATYAAMPPQPAAPYHGAPYQGAPNQGAPYQGVPYQGVPYQGAPYQGAPYQAGPYPVAPYQVVLPQTVLVNPCSTCGAPAAARCTFGISTGVQCTQLMCLMHNQSVPGPRGGAYPHCPAHGAMLAQRRAMFRQNMQNSCCSMCTIL